MDSKNHIRVQNQHLIDHDYILHVDERKYVLNQLFDHDYALLAIKSDDDGEEVPDEIIVDEPKMYRILPGIQRNTKVYVDDFGYKYYKKKLLVNTVTLICERQRNPSRPMCHGTASINKNEMDNRLTIGTPHNHEPPVIDFNVPFLRAALGERGLDPKNTTKSVRSIYDSEIIKHQEAAKNYTFKQSLARVKRMRRLRRLKC